MRVEGQATTIEFSLLPFTLAQVDSRYLSTRLRQSVASANSGRSLDKVDFPDFINLGNSPRSCLSTDDLGNTSKSHEPYSLKTSLASRTQDDLGPHRLRKSKVGSFEGRFSTLGPAGGTSSTYVAAIHKISERTGSIRDLT